MPPDAGSNVAHPVSALVSAASAPGDFGRVNCELIALADLGGANRRLVSFAPDLTSGQLRGRLAAQVNVGALVSAGMPPKLHVVGGRNDAIRGRVYQVDLSSGEARPLFDSGLDRVVAGTSDASGMVFVWSRGLVRVDVQARTTERLVASNLPVEQLAVDDHGAVLAYTHDAVFRYDAPSRSVLRLGDVATHVDAIAGTGARLLALRSPEEIAPRVELILADAATARLRRSRSVDIPGLDVRGAPQPFSHLSWPAACPSPRMEERGDVIQSVTAIPANPCVGETVTLRVVARDPEDPTATVATTIDGLPGPTRLVQVPRVVPGPLPYGAWAMTDDGLYELENIVVDVRECPSLRVPLLLGAANPYDPRRLDLWVANPTDFGVGATYDFDFGDGTSVAATAPHASHDLSASLAPDRIQHDFTMSVRVTTAEGIQSEASRTFTVANDYALMKASGVAELPSTGPGALDEDSHYDAGPIEFTVRNPESVPATLDTLRLRYHSCDDTAAPTDRLQGTHLVIGATQTIPLTVTVESLRELEQRNVCAISVYASGTVGPLTASVSAHVPIDYGTDGVQYEPLADPAMISLLDAAVARGLALPGAAIDEAALYDLGLDGRLPLYSPDGIQVLATGDRCAPGETPPVPGVSCQVAPGEWEWRAPSIPNAYKGDAVLSAGCGPIYQVLNNVDPPQYFTHNGMMTRNHVEVRHSTGNMDYPRSFPSSILGHAPFDGYEDHALRYNWPGTVTQDVAHAYLKEIIVAPQNDRAYAVSAFQSAALNCTTDELLAGQPRLIYPRVVRPPLNASPTVREGLHRAADYFEASVDGHYRFFGYTNAGRAADSVVDAADPATWARGTRGLVCSSAIWWSLRNVGLTMEGALLEDTDMHPTVRRQIDSETVDGLYFYDEAERSRAGQALWTATYHDAASSSAFSWLGAARTQIPNQLVSCFASDDCAPEQEDTGYEEPGVGRAVSPDDLLGWDVPDRGGPYGESERLYYVPTVYRPVMRWAPSVSSGNAVDVQVTYLGAPVEGARVEIEGALPESTSLVSDAAGRVHFTDLPQGRFAATANLVVGGVFDGAPKTWDVASYMLAGSNEAVDVPAATTAPYVVALQPPPTNAYLVNVNVELDIRDDDVSGNDEYGHVDLTKHLLLYDAPGNDAATIDFRKCVDDEVQVVGHIQLQLVETSPGSFAVDVTRTVDAYEWKKCTTQTDERFGYLHDGTAVRLFDDGDPLVDGPSEVLETPDPIDWTNTETAGGDQVTGHVWVKIYRPISFVPPNADSFRQLVIQADAHTVDDEIWGTSESDSTVHGTMSLDPYRNTFIYAYDTCDLDSDTDEIRGIITLIVELLPDGSMDVQRQLQLREGKGDCSAGIDETAASHGDSFVVPPDTSLAVPDVTLERPGPVDSVKDSIRFSNWSFTNQRMVSP